MKTWPLAATALLGSPASAETIRLTPIMDARLRWEEVKQAEIIDDANAVTIRVRSGVVADAGPFQALIESEATLAIDGRYNSGTNGQTAYPLVVDPQNIELNRAQVRYAANGLAVTAGRQRIELADQRFVGAAPFRQNEQTFDAARVQWGDVKRLFADITYAWSVRTVNGINGQGARQQAVSGDNLFAIVGARTPVGTLTGFAYLVDQDELAVQAYRLSNQTYGVRLAGTQPLGNGVTIAYSASWARQRDWHRNPNHYAATYWSTEANGAAGPVTLTVGHEVLGADDGRALTSVQTPLSSLFKFQGWADKFTTTPPNGLRDLYGSAGLGWKNVGPFDAASASVIRHRFRSDRLDQRYGSEWDLIASVKRGRMSLSARYARYQAVEFASDTNKVWLEANWTL